MMIANQPYPRPGEYRCTGCGAIHPLPDGLPEFAARWAMGKAVYCSPECRNQADALARQQLGPRARKEPR